MRVLLLGVGMQGRVALDDLMRSEDVTSVVAADAGMAELKARAETMGYGDKLRCEPLDASDSGSVDRLFAAEPDVAIDLLPVEFIARVAESAIRHRVHLVNTFFVPDTLRGLGPAAEAAGVAILPEFGMDPGIDLVMLGEAVRSLDAVYEIHSYGGGIPSPEAADNPIQYKISWTFEGALRAYCRPGRVVAGGRPVQIGADELFAPENIHEVEIGDFGPMEAYISGDAIEYCEALGVDLSALRAAGRYSLRWPGHSAFWKKLVDLHLLDEEPVVVRGRTVDRIEYLVAALEPHLQYGDGEADLGILRVVVVGRRGDQEVTITSEVVDRRDPATGFTAMSRLVGFTASAGAQMLARGEIRGPGLLSPLRDIPYDRFMAELQRRGITMSQSEV